MTIKTNSKVYEVNLNVGQLIKITIGLAIATGIVYGLSTLATMFKGYVG